MANWVPRPIHQPTRPILTPYEMGGVATVDAGLLVRVLPFDGLGPRPIQPPAMKWGALQPLMQGCW